jgi:peroxin-3
LQDSQFTVLALLPTLASQVQQELDVEARTTELGERAKEEREKKVRETQAMKEKEQEEERTREAATEEEPEREEAAEFVDAEKEAQPEPHEKQETSVKVEEKLDNPSLPASSDDSGSTSLSNGTCEDAPSTASSSLNPDAPSFSFNPSAPSFEPSANPEIPPSTAEPASASTVAVDAAPLANGDATVVSSAKEDEEATSNEAEAGEAAPAAKSWATVVKEGVPDAEASVVVPVSDGEKVCFPLSFPLYPAFISASEVLLKGYCF